MSRFRLPPTVLRASLDEEEVLLNTETGVYHLVNATGRALLASFEAGLDLEGAARRLTEETGRAPDRVLSDSRAFVRAMAQRGLLEEAEEVHR